MCVCVLLKLQFAVWYFSFWPALSCEPSSVSFLAMAPLRRSVRWVTPCFLSRWRSQFDLVEKKASHFGQGKGFWPEGEERHNRTFSLVFLVIYVLYELYLWTGNKTNITNLDTELTLVEDFTQLNVHLSDCYCWCIRASLNYFIYC